MMKKSCQIVQNADLFAYIRKNPYLCRQKGTEKEIVAHEMRAVAEKRRKDRWINGLFVCGAIRAAAKKATFVA